MKPRTIQKIIFLLSLLILPSLTIAASYTLLEPIGGDQQTMIKVSDPMTYLRSLYWWVVGLTIALSVLMLIVGGFQYTLSWADEKQKGEGRSRIENAITGLIIALTAFLLLNTINPDLVSFEMSDAGSCKANNTPATTQSVPPTTGAPTGGGAVGGTGSPNPAENVTPGTTNPEANIYNTQTTPGANIEAGTEVGPGGQPLSQ